MDYVWTFLFIYFFCFTPSSLHQIKLLIRSPFNFFKEEGHANLQQKIYFYFDSTNRTKKKKKDIKLRNQSIVENNRMVLHDNITQTTIHAW